LEKGIEFRRDCGCELLAFERYGMVERKLLCM
jgi:hypothetical protein